MERLRERLLITKQALSTFDEVLKLPYSKIVRDAAIQRFEFTLETVWKLAQRYLDIVEGMSLGSPKSVMRACFQVNLLNEEETNILLRAITERNLTSHTYNEKLAMQIYSHLPKYCQLFDHLYNSINKAASK